VSDRFRELESPLLARTKDVVLMATVSSYQGMTHPTRNELKQFAELFEPIFKASSQEARRNAVAALSRCETVPAGVAWFLATQPIELAAIFLTSSPALDNDLLIAVARSQGAAHAKAIAARENLSVKVVDALVAQHQMLPSRARTVASPTATGAGETTAAREHGCGHKHCRRRRRTRGSLADPFCPAEGSAWLFAHACPLPRRQHLAEQPHHAGPVRPATGNRA